MGAGGGTGGAESSIWCVLGGSGVGSDLPWVGGAEAGGAGAVIAGDESLPKAMADGASCAAAGSGCLAAEDFLSPAVAGAAADTGWAETPDLPLLGASCVVAAIGAAIGAGALEFGARFGVKGAGSLLEVLLAMANPVSEALAVCAVTVVALGERVTTGAVWSMAEPAVAAGPAPESAAVELIGLGPTGATAELNDADSTGAELLTLAVLALGTAVGCAFGDSVTGAELLLAEDCGAGIGAGDVVVIDIDIGIGIGIGDGVDGGAEDAGATLVAGSPREAGRGL